MGVVAFSSDVRYPNADPCYSAELALVSIKVKAHFETFIDSLMASGSANYTKAFASAFTLLNESRDSENTNRSKQLLLVYLIRFQSIY